MISKEQKIEMLQKLAKILKELPTSNSIKEISEKTNIPTSTIQRYLNKKELIIELLELNNNLQAYEETFERIQQWLKNAKKEGHKKGGMISQEKYGYSQNGEGKFTGHKQKR